MIDVYGIKSCGSVKKAIMLLEKHDIPFVFLDLKKQSPNQKLIASWIQQKGISVVLNTKGMNYKKLKKEGVIPDDLNTPSSSLVYKQTEILEQYPLLLKRPIIVSSNHLIIGYDETAIIALIQEYQSNKL